MQACYCINYVWKRYYTVPCMYATFLHWFQAGRLLFLKYALKHARYVATLVSHARKMSITVPLCSVS
jgi:hypothetical protein